MLSDGAYFIIFIKSSLSIAALDLKDKLAVPQYTASAPYKNAIFAFSKDPAGANNSTFFIFLQILPFFVHILVYYQNAKFSSNYRLFYKFVV